MYDGGGKDQSMTVHLSPNSEFSPKDEPSSHFTETVPVSSTKSMTPWLPWRSPVYGSFVYWSWTRLPMSACR